MYWLSVNGVVCIMMLQLYGYKITYYLTRLASLWPCRGTELFQVQLDVLQLPFSKEGC
jgi:hypothetical protein